MANEITNKEYEQIVLGSAMIDESAREKVLLNLDKTDFFYENHQEIYEQISKLFNDGQPVDIFIIANCLKKITIEELQEMENKVIVVSSVTYYISKVKGISIHRQAVKNTSEFMEGKLTRKELMEKLDVAVSEKRELIKISDVVKDSYDYIEKLIDGNTEILGIKTGLIDLDNKIGGMRPGNYIVIAGRPSMGKTSLGLNICYNVAKRDNKPVLIFSFETLAQGLIMRLLYCASRVSEISVKKQFIPKIDKSKLKTGMDELKQLPIFFIDNPDLTPTDIRIRARQIKRKYPDLSLIMIDYLQEISTNKNYDSEYREISEVSTQINRMAKELKVPVLALSQLNRNCEMRENKRPRLSDLRSSGKIEQDADIVMLLYRDFVYNPKAEDVKPNKLECGIAKQRDGEVGPVDLYFSGEQKRVDNYYKGREFL